MIFLINGVEATEPYLLDPNINIININDTYNETPYKEEINTKTANLTIILPNIVYTKVKYTKLFRVDNLLYPNQKIGVSVNYNVSSNNYTLSKSFTLLGINKYKSAGTGELYVEIPGNYTLCGKLKQNNIHQDQTIICKNFTMIDISTVVCDGSLNLDLEERYYYDEEKLSFKFKSNSTMPNILEYWIEDVFGNLRKEKSNSTTMNRQLTLKIESGIEIFRIIGNLHTPCNDTNLTNNQVLREIIILKNSTESNVETDSGSVISIEQVYNAKKLKFGGGVKIKAKILRKNTSKSTIQAYIVGKDEKKVSEVTKLGIYSKDFLQEISFYIKLNEKCKETGSYTLVLEGLGITKKQKIKIKCEKEKVEANKKSNKEKKRKKQEETKTTQQPNNQKNLEIENAGITAIQLQLNSSQNMNETYVQISNAMSKHENDGNISQTKITIYKKQNTKNTTKWLLILLLCLNLAVIVIKKQ